MVENWQDIKLFFYEGNNVRVVIINNEPWFVGIDVLRALGYEERKSKGTRTYQIRKILRDSEIKTVVVPFLGDSPSSNGGEYEKGEKPYTGCIKRVRMLVISESGLYRLIMRSDKPGAAAFQDWVTMKVLPSIRRTGKYNIAQDMEGFGIVETSAVSEVQATQPGKMTLTYKRMGTEIRLEMSETPENLKAIIKLFLV